MTGIILAGGESRRMGADKAFLKIAGVPMVERVMGSLRGICRDIVIVTNDPDRYRNYGVRVVRDVGEQRGSLVGIYSGLLHAKDEYSFVVACDMPFLHPALIVAMSGLAPGYDVVVPRVNGYLEPLHAVYRKTLTAIIGAQVQGGNLRIRDLFNKIRVRYMTEQEIELIDPSHRSFKNVNTRQEYEEAACADWECRS